MWKRWTVTSDKEITISSHATPDEVEELSPQNWESMEEPIL